MDDPAEFAWEGLALQSLVPLNSSNPNSPPASPDSTPDWSVCGPFPLPDITQVDLDGELCDSAESLPTSPRRPSTPPTSAPPISTPSSNLSVAYGRVEKKIPDRPRPLVKKPPVTTSPVSTTLLDDVSPFNSPSEITPQLVPARVQPSTPIPVSITRPVAPAPPKPPIRVKTEPTPVEPVSLKEKREREARQFPRNILGNLDGTTSAEVRKMNTSERELVLYKRKLRNRESARRSRQKRQATLSDLQSDIDELATVAERMVDLGLNLREENDKLRNMLAASMAEVRGLRSVCGGNVAADNERGAMKMKLGG